MSHKNGNKMSDRADKPTMQELMFIEKHSDEPDFLLEEAPRVADLLAKFGGRRAYV